jgi:hypothetical protein
VGRAAVSWAALLALGRALWQNVDPAYYAEPDVFWLTLIFSTIVPAAIAVGVWRAARGLAAPPPPPPLPPSPSPSP